MEISYLGHSSFRIKTKEAVVVTDPFDPKKVGLKYSGVTADIVTISHDHFDHNAKDLVGDTKKVFDGPGEYELLGVSIIGIPTYHDEKKGDERGKNTIFIFEFEDLRVAHLGDLGHSLDEKTIEAIGEIDVLMLPVGGEYTIGPNEALEVLRAIEPNITIPMHYQVPSLDPGAFSKLKPVEEFLKLTGLSVETLPKLSMKSGEMGEEQKVILLNTKI